MTNILKLKFLHLNFLLGIILLSMGNSIISKNIGCGDCDSCYPRSIFVPRQLSYNPILENALLYNLKSETNQRYAFSLKPIYTQSVGSKFKSYFNICDKCNMSVREDNTGDINPLWFSVISTNTTYNSSQLSFCPKRQTYGSMIYFSVRPTDHFDISLNTAIVGAKNNMCICEQCIQNLGTCDNKTITQSFANCYRKFGRICGAQCKAGLDDIQLKFIYNSCSLNRDEKLVKNKDGKDEKECKDFVWSAYGLVGIPTGKGSRAEYLFEPLVGSKHAQLGFGATMHWNMKYYDHGIWSLQGEAKYRYAFKAQECRSFDLCKNGQWSRYMLFVSESDKNITFPAINNLTFKADVTPGSSLDLYLATNLTHNKWQFELGYDFWYRACEKISLCCATLPVVGVADLVGIVKQSPQSASTANISQGVLANANQIKSDSEFVRVTINDINCFSGAQQRAISNSVYGSIGYKFDIKNDNIFLLGINCAYEAGACKTPDNVTTWLNCDFYF